MLLDERGGEKRNGGRLTVESGGIGREVETVKIGVFHGSLGGDTLVGVIV